MEKKSEKNVRAVFSVLSKAAARKKVYAQKALQAGRQDISRMLRAISASESVQARRLLHALRGQIDTTDHYLSTIFETELEETIKEYDKSLADAKEEGNRALIQALSQLRAAEGRLRSFYAKESKDLTIKEDEKYFVCQFCGYVNLEKAPESCPICGAGKKGFLESP